MGRAVLVRLWCDEVCAAQIGSVRHKLVRGMTCWSNFKRHDDATLCQTTRGH